MCHYTDVLGITCGMRSGSRPPPASKTFRYSSPKTSPTLSSTSSPGPATWRSTKSSSGQRNRKDRFDPPACLPPPGEVDAKKDNRATQNLVRRETLSEQYHARRHANERDQVLVDEHSVRPDLRDTPLPGPEP